MYVLFKWDRIVFNMFTIDLLIYITPTIYKFDIIFVFCAEMSIDTIFVFCAEMSIDEVNG